MKKSNKILSFLLAILMVVSIIPITASAETPTSGTCGENATWEFDETTGTLTISGEGAMYDYYYHFYSSKDEVDTRPWASYDDLIEFVVIDDGITYIGEYAFFSFNLLTIVTIPESVTNIGEYAFEGVEPLVVHYKGTEAQWNNVTVGGANTGLHYEKIRFYFVDFPVSDSGTCGDTLTWDFDATTSILTISGTGAMYNDLGDYRDNSTRKQFDGERGWDYYKYHIEKIVITDGVTYIGQNAFDYHPNLKEVVIPDTVTEIHLHAFDNCNSLSDVYYSGTENDWNNIRKWDSLIGNSNSSLNNATIHYNYHTHVYESVVTEPNCTDKGYTTYTCECGDSYIDDYVDALGHTEEILPAVAPSCTEIGLTEGVKCSVCGETLTEQKELPANGHTEETTPEVAPTCTEVGFTEGAKCSVCGETLTEQKELPANGHTAANTVEENYVAPTCTSNGSVDKVVYCSVCDEEISRETVTIETIEHTLSEYEKIIITPTCSENGSKEVVSCCIECDRVLNKKVITVDALGHSCAYAVYENAVESTCTETGSVEKVMYCSLCDEEISRETET